MKPNDLIALTTFRQIAEICKRTSDVNTSRNVRLIHSLALYAGRELQKQPAPESDRRACIITVESERSDDGSVCAVTDNPEDRDRIVRELRSGLAGDKEHRVHVYETKINRIIGK